MNAHAQATITEDAEQRLEQVRARLQANIDADSLDLPMLPEVAGQVLAITNDPDADVSALAQLIQSDPSLAGHVLRIANSPAYMPTMPIVSLKQAVARMGMRVIAEIALAASVGARCFDVPGYERDVENLWKHALASGAYGKEVARRCRKNVESMFLCGLLHDIGKPIVLQAVSDIVSANHLSIDRKGLGTLLSHYSVRVGTLVANRWELPAPVVESIRFASNYSKAEQCPDQAQMTHAAHLFASHMLSPDTLPRDVLVTRPIFAELSFYPDDVDALIGEKDEIAKLLEALG